MRPISSIEDLIGSCTSKTPWWRRYQILTVLCICNSSDAVETVCMGYILACLNDISLLEEMLGASVIIGMLVGGICTGQVGDILGGKISLQFSILLSATGGVLSSFTPSVNLLIICRAMGGFGIGGVVPNVYALGSELFSKERKSKMLTLIATSWIFGSIYASIAGWILLGNDIDGHRIIPGGDWRMYAIVCAAPSYVATLLTFFLVESPSFLIEKKKTKRAAEALSYLCASTVTAEDVRKCEVLTPEAPTQEETTSPCQLAES